MRCLMSHYPLLWLSLRRYVAVDAAMVRQQMAATMGRDNRAVLTYVPNGSDEDSA